MNTPGNRSPRGRIEYPDSDGEPIAENTLQFDWIVKIESNLSVLFRNRADVFVAADLFWYPVEGDNKTRTAPDAMVAFGRPKGHRGSYMQWVEGGIAPQVVFEVLSPSGRGAALDRKHEFYERFGVEEFYVYDPDNDELSGWQREGNCLRRISSMDGWVSRRLEIRFDPASHPLVILRPDGSRFQTYVEMALEYYRRLDEIDAIRTETRRIREETRRLRAETRQIEERTRIANEVKRLEAKLREHGVEP